MSHRYPKVGDRVTVPVTGEVINVDAELGKVEVQGTTPGQTHVEWLFEFHWGTEFEFLAPPPKVGDMVTAENIDQLPIGAAVASTSGPNGIIAQRYSDGWHTTLDGSSRIRAELGWPARIIHIPDVTE